MTIQPEGDAIRKATKWISAERQDHPETKLKVLVEQASLRFDLSPSEAEFLFRFFSGSRKDAPSQDPS